MSVQIRAIEWGHRNCSGADLKVKNSRSSSETHCIQQLVIAVWDM